MRLDQALTKIGVQVLKVEEVPQANQLIILLRVKPDALSRQRWNQTATKLVLCAEKGKRSGIWGAEIAKVLYAQGGSVRFVWRAILHGELNTAQRLFGEAALEALRTGVEVTSAPLVGQVEYPHDPAKGKLKGGYAVSSEGASPAASMIAGHFMPGVPNA